MAMMLTADPVSHRAFEITKSILMICILERHILRISLHPLAKSFKLLFVNFSPEVHIRLFGVDRYLVDVVDRYLVDVVDRHSQRKIFQLGLIALAQVFLQIADLSSLLSSSKLRSEMDFEFPSSEITKSILMICILERQILRNPLHPFVKSFKFLLVNFSPEVHIRLFGVDGYMVDVVDLYLVADLSSLLSPSKLRSEMVFEFPLSGVHQDLVNVLDMVLKVIDRCSSAVVDRRCPF
ncbi:hypothetical protein F2Q70_00017507 [Brassica cretica]|uniref:Uncharacterized protein n=1 Tax=Brassica cretica TaxID=69181 RepID=A0A8S9I0R1_BRACR|nr:hypothetical protein F2Q70_00017507 [Brassica cretica]